MSSTERRALLLLLGLGLAGQGVRWGLERPGQAPGQVELLAALPPRSPLAYRDSVLAMARPLAAGERIDADRATAAELARLPRVGPALARAIVAYREAHGAFGGLPGLDRVPGVGPGLLAALAGHLEFGGTALGGASQTAAPLAPLSGSTAGLAPAPGPSPAPHPGGPSGRLDLNSASAQALDSLPGIGPARAASIVQYRAQHGPFRSIDDLGEVPGVGPAALARLRDHLSVP
ncbi:MAG TPA: helix-hairpin-helix domain-containing protein [Gemmatimonadales bacterium]|nr:helix-hairpin-helix domain-containing protein [Gemmatimonadales bacterium]